MSESPDYQLTVTSPPQDGYPSVPSPDSFSETPFLPDYESRRQAYLAHIRQNPAPENTKGVWHELARLVAGGAPHAGVLQASLDFIAARKDCADFVLHGLLRLLFSPQLDPNRTLSGDFLALAHQTVLNFKYFPDEPGIDSLCTWTESHYILYTWAAYLAGLLHPQERFSNSGESGRQKMEKNRPRLLRWLDLRFHTGFSEWLSHVYYDEDLAALLSLYDFAGDEEIHQKAGMVIDLIMLDMALNSFRGVFGATHGRSYENSKKWAREEGTTDSAKLLFGMGIFSGCDNMSATAFALSRYRLPAVIEQIAQDTRALVNRQRLGLRIDELEKWGLHPDNFEDGMHCLTLEAYLHPRTIANTLRMFDTCNWWQNSFLDAFQPYRGLLKALGAIGGLRPLARLLQRDLCRNTREQVNIYTCKTPDYMLSTAQDYRQGYGGDQQHIWQATLGPDAVCFTTHPARLEGVTPNYWAGSGLLPRAAQHRNVAIVIYKLEKIPALYVPIRHFYTHAWFPQDKFEEVLEKNGWIFARKGQGYLALRSQKPYFWNDGNAPVGDIFYRRQGEDLGRELIVPGKQNIWICQMGRLAEDGPFAEFAQKIAAAPLTFNGLEVRYQSPGNGLLRFGWAGKLSLDGVALTVSEYPRYDNPYVQAGFDPQEVQVECGQHRLSLDWEKVERLVT